MTIELEEERLRFFACKNRHNTSKSIVNIFLGEKDHRITMRLVYRRISSLGFMSYRPRSILPLTNLHQCGEELNLVSCVREAIFNICCSFAPTYVLGLDNVLK